jgi:hypothetical protein
MEAESVKPIGYVVVAALITLAILPVSTSGQVIINEVLANEPGSYRSLEWIELYAPEVASFDLSDAAIITTRDTITFAPGTTIGATGYLVVCRKLESADGSASFEGHWGDSSGIWGDALCETIIDRPIEASFGLSNDSGVVRLLLGGVEVSALTWTESGLDGHSWERIIPIDDDIAQSEEAGGSTPGYLNSLTPVPRDLALVAGARISSGWSVVTLSVRNVGLTVVDSAGLTLYLVSEAVQPTLTPLESLSLGPIDVGADTVLEFSYRFDDLWTFLAATISDDDRLGNNHCEFVVPGADYPPIIITEVLANPADAGASEWVEIRNRSTDTQSLSGWRIGDWRETFAIDTTTMMIAPDERILLAQDTIAFFEQYSTTAGTVLQPVGWSRLNDDEDTVRLADPYGLVADQFAYSSLFSSSHTWSRGEDDRYGDRWGRSENAGGTPTLVNHVVFADPGAGVTLSVEPAVFSPDNDGFADSCLISIAAADLEEYELRVYDREGRVVCNLKRGPYRSNRYAWYGVDDNGDPLPVGIYIVYFEAADGSAKTGVAIAR